MARHCSIACSTSRSTSFGDGPVGDAFSSSADEVSTALRMAACSVGSLSSRYSATWVSVTRRRSGRNESEVSERRKDGEREDAERDDGGRAEPERLEARGRQEQRRQRAGDDNDGAPQRQLQAPAVADPADDVDELLRRSDPLYPSSMSAFSLSERIHPLRPLAGLNPPVGYLKTSRSRLPRPGCRCST